MFNKTIAIAVSVPFLFALVISQGFVSAQAGNEPVKHTFIEKPVDLPNKQFNVKVRTIKWPVGYKSAPHTHAGPGPRYVLSGRVEIDDQGVTNQYGAGEVFWHPGGFPHTAENVADTDTEVLIIELLPIK